MVLNHLCIYVKDMERSKAFYTPLLQLLGEDISLEVPNYYVGYSNNSFGFCPNKRDHPSYAHFAFGAKSKEQVNEFYEKALTLGATCNGKPGIRTLYGPNYYGAFVLDPDGNNMEIVYKGDA
ncbi:glyoxalase/bleomycin resistance protein/dioxygenase [Halteromyces radiatus]|uniref:glyoxalase/bleomycin resistance protein/dioxygenase n=1 Tax=Halteromyces radiatus TaxID=101107 RepID=UPI00222073AD|nr:glyoxalase/bleomycin resistance protein/dioxygenase [Halteromyces radiatus]KAI8092666.1 glyoxalase/bleomycin resistance protein/dioxygenase [Halteromyces radiatus]